ncbi:HK97 family phage prohead protease [Carnobacteriaceae bacterium zg-ZUI252]|nr:HK97 family phage prohead protease [Carnobacteriaceae bacterium zg-ZUI252]
MRNTEDEKEQTLVGYALKFNCASDNIFDFEEVLVDGCLKGADLSNVLALINHDANKPVARVGKNMTLEVDEIGLKFTIKPTNTSYSRDLIENIRSGIINKCSFAFTVSDEEGAQKWKRDGSKIIREIHKIDKVYDVSIVTNPAYENTEVVLSQRSKEEFEKINVYKNELEKIRLDLMVNG